MKRYLWIIVIIGVLFVGFLVARETKENTNVPIVNDQVLVENYIREHITTLAPEQPVLGGTWYVTNVRIDSIIKTGSMSYEDGHIAGEATFTYVRDGNQIVIHDVKKSN